jgi:hypothetical protein
MPTFISVAAVDFGVGIWTGTGNCPSGDGSPGTDCGQNYPLESNISAYVEQSFRSLPADIRSIKLSINDWKGLRIPLGGGLVETVHHGYELEFGLWAPHGEFLHILRTGMDLTLVSRITCSRTHQTATSSAGRELVWSIQGRT